MENRVYYGEYSLKHWINLILTRNIELPPYQRHFVWQERDIKRLVKSFKAKEFVPPVTIALYRNGKTDKQNLILDGQQRLTSLLLAYIGYRPDPQASQYATGSNMANGDDSAVDDTQTGISTSQGPILWRFDELLEEQNNSKEDIIDRIKEDISYLPLEDSELKNLRDDFFENTYLGFSYIVPMDASPVTIQQLFTRLFRNINYFGKKLDPEESRKSLYYQNVELARYFEGKILQGKNEVDVLCGLMIQENLQPCKIDFVRYLSILSQYQANGCNANKVLVGYAAYSYRESFYADYVSHVSGLGEDEQESRPEKFRNFDFSKTFPNGCWANRYEELRKSIGTLKGYMTLGSQNSFSSWIDADYWLIGLIFHIVFEGKQLKNSLSRNVGGQNITLQAEITNMINIKRNSPAYKRTPNSLRYLRERLQESCDIFAHYVQ